MRTSRTRRSMMKLPVGGIGLLIACAVLVAVPFVWFPLGEHPLSSTEDFNVCAVLDKETLRTLPYEVLARERQSTRDLGSQCLLDLGFPDLGDAQTVSLDITVLTQAQMRGERMSLGTAKYWQTFVDEARASGVETATVAGPWRHAAVLHQQNGGVWLFIEDFGVVIWLRANEVTQEELVTFASALASRLRAE